MMDILILGGGYAAIWGALGAVRQLDAAGGSRQLSVGLVSRQPWLTARPRLYERDLAEHDAQIPLQPVLDAVGVSFIEANVEGIDPATRRVMLGDGRSLTFGTLLLATGSVARAAPIAGFARYGYGVDTWPEASCLWRRLHDLQSSSASVIVVGAGFTGLELATELAGWRDSVARNVQITLLDGADDIATGYSDAARQVLRRTLNGLRIEVRCGAVAERLAPGSLELRGGETLACDVAVWAGGLQPSALAGAIAAPHADDGRLITDQYLRVQDGVFAAGDVAAVPTPEGPSTVLSCQHALSTGTFAGHNAARERLGLPLVGYAPLPYVTCLDLGPAGALLTTGFERTLKLAGDAAKPIKQNINRRIIVPPLEGGREALLAAATLERKRSLPA